MLFFLFLYDNIKEWNKAKSERKDRTFVRSAAQLIKKKMDDYSSRFMFKLMFYIDTSHSPFSTMIHGKVQHFLTMHEVMSTSKLCLAPFDYAIKGKFIGVTALRVYPGRSILYNNIVPKTMAHIDNTPSAHVGLH